MQVIKRFINSPWLVRIRRNHALEHATIHILSERFPHTSFVGRSDAGGFFLIGQVSTENLADAVQEAQARLQAGERHLAVHPNCGTNMLTAGMIAGGASFLALQGSTEKKFKDRLDRLPIAMMASTFAFMLAQPLGAAVQRRVTTQSDLGSMQIASIRLLSSGRAKTHRILTTD